MTIKVKANGLTFSFPDGTTQAEIEQVLDEHFNPGVNVLEEAGKAVLKGAAELAQNAADMMPGAKTAANLVAEVLPESVLQWYTKPSDAVDAAGLAPETTAGKVAAEVLPALAGGVGASMAARNQIAKLGNKWARWGADNLIASIGAQAAADGDLSAGTTATDVALGVGINAALPVLGRAVKTAIRGNQEAKILDAAQQINQQITGDFVPSRAVLDGSRLSAHIENISGNSLFSAGHMQRFNEANAAALEEFSDVLRKGMADGNTLTPSEMGDAIQAAYQSFVKTSGEKAEVYFTAAIQRAGNHRIGLAGTRAVLNNINAIARNNPEIAALIQSPEFRQLSQGILNAKNGVDLQGAIRLKSAIRNMMDNPGLGLKTADDRDLSLLYNALNDDVTRSLDAGAPFGALGAWEEGNRVWSAFMDDQSKLKRLLDGKDGDSIYSAIFGKAGGSLSVSPTRIKQLVQILPGDIGNQIRAEIIYRAGREAAGQAGNEGQKFSAAAFLTNWTKLKAAGLDDLLTGQHKADIEALATISDRLKQVGKAANFSNTANHLNLTNAMQGVGAAFIGVNPLALVPLALPALTARFMTNPELARSLRQLATAAQNDPIRARALIALVVAAADQGISDDEVEVIIQAIEQVN